MLEYIVPTLVGGLVVYVGYFVKSHVDRRNQSKLDELQADRSIYFSILEILPVDSISIDFVKNHDYWTPFKDEQVQELRTFKYTMLTPDKSFHNPLLNQYLQNFASSTNKYLEQLVQLTSVKNGDWVTCVRLDCDPDYDIPTEVRAEIEAISELSETVNADYERLIIESRKHLKV